jgi:hypothetical protein
LLIEAKANSLFEWKTAFEPSLAASKYEIALSNLLNGNELVAIKTPFLYSFPSLLPFPSRTMV